MRDWVCGCGEAEEESDGEGEGEVDVHCEWDDGLVFGIRV